MSGKVDVVPAGAGGLVLQLAGAWNIHSGIPPLAPVLQHLQAQPAPTKIAFDAHDLQGWDSSLVSFLLDLHNHATVHQIPIDTDALPEGVRKLLALATAVPERGRGSQVAAPQSFLARAGTAAARQWRESLDVVGFIGEVAISFGRFFTGRANFKRDDLLLSLQQSGAEALPIIALISILVGLILAFVGAVQLKLFAAEAFVANLVAIGMLREMGSMMTAIIMAGRTGAAYAAQIGTMQVNEEIDALRTVGISPIDFLVLPRLLGLILMMPLLTIFANLLGILGGFLVGVFALDIPVEQYINQTIAWLRLQDLMLGIIKSFVFGALIAVVGCLRGIQSGRNAAAVGAAATSAVVTIIVWIIILSGLFAVVTTVMGI
jgi:phospholipid/cholesterol/gamma-HCH transport system permease protein